MKIRLMKGSLRFSWVLILTALLTVVLNACGSGGGGDSSASSVIPLKTSTIRNYAQGDSWNYTANGTLNDGITTINLSGTITSQILFSTRKSPVTLDNCLENYSVMNLTGSDNTVTIDSYSYFLQDANGSINTYGADVGSGDIWVMSPLAGYFLERQSPVANGQTSSSSVAFDDGSTLTHSYPVTAKEDVTTDIGTYEAYRISTNSTYNYALGIIDRMVESSTDWYVPGLGLIKSDIKASYYSGGVFWYSLNATVTITGTSVSY